MFSLLIAYWLISAFFHWYNYIQHKNVVKISLTLPIWYNLWYNIADHAGNKKMISHIIFAYIFRQFNNTRSLFHSTWFIYNNTSLVRTGTEHDSSFFPICKYAFLTVFFILWKETQSDLHANIMYLSTTFILKTIVLGDDS